MPDLETSVCSRTPAVRDAIAAAVAGVSACAGVTSTHLAALTALDVSRRSPQALQAGSATVGTDWRPGSVMLGLVVGRSISEGGYQSPSDSGVAAATRTGAYPWDSYAFTERAGLWGVAGYGAGTLTLTPDGGDATRTDLSLWMAAAGLRGG